MMFLKATAIPKNMQTNRSAGEVSNSRSNNQPTSAPPAGPAISSVSSFGWDLVATRAFCLGFPRRFQLHV
jgi:hypothetical protein